MSIGDPSKIHEGGRGVIKMIVGVNAVHASSYFYLLFSFGNSSLKSSSFRYTDLAFPLANLINTVQS